MGKSESEADRGEQQKKNTKPKQKWPEWYAELRSYQTRSTGKAVWQVINTLVPYADLDTRGFGFPRGWPSVRHG